MGTEVLRPQDCLAGRIKTSPAIFPRRKGCNYGNSYSNHRINTSAGPSQTPARSSRKPQIRADKADQKRRQAQSEPSTSRKWSSDDGRAGRPELVMENVTILRRGGSLDSKMKSDLFQKKEVGDKEPCLRTPMTRKCDVYAGSAFVVSPEPSSLPLPSFSKKKTVSFDDSATKDLRRLLRLD